MGDRMWHRIRYASQWDPQKMLELATRALNLKNVKAMTISIDPLHGDNNSLREFWYQVTLPAPASTNPAMNFKVEVRNNRQPPFFIADLVDNRRLVFKTSGMLPVDVMRNFNRLLGNPEVKGMEEEVSEGRYAKSIAPF